VSSNAYLNSEAHAKLAIEVDAEL